VPDPGNVPIGFIAFPEGCANLCFGGPRRHRMLMAASHSVLFARQHARRGGRLMAMLENVTPVLLTFNEEANLERTLAQLNWATDIVIVDSMSSDDTTRIARSRSNIRFFQRAFDAHAAQWNYAISETSIRTDWILALDADYVLSDDLIAELKALCPSSGVNAYWVSFRYCVWGKPLRGTLYPPVLSLFRKGTGHYVQKGHTQHLVIEGRTARLNGRILHDDRKPLSRWFAAQQRYARLEAEHLLAADLKKLSRNDRIRRTGWLAPPLVFIYTLIAKRCLLDGWPGWLYVLQRTVAEMMIALELADRRMRSAAKRY
jgi:glycosyltransferase involved in cell wall biosynthesis